MMSMEEAYSWRPRILDHPKGYECGFDLSFRQREKPRAPKMKVAVYRGNTLIKQYNSIAEAVRLLRIPKGRMAGLLKTGAEYNGFRYEKAGTDCVTTVKVMTVDGVLCGIFDTPPKADNAMGFARDTCTRAIKTGKPYRGKYIITRVE